MRTVPIRLSGYPHNRCADKVWSFLHARQVTDFRPLAVNKLYFAFIMIYFRLNVFLQLGTYHFYLQGGGRGLLISGEWVLI